LKLGHTPPPPKVPFIFNKFISHLQGAGVNVVQQGSKFYIAPQTDKDIVALSQGEIKEPLSYKLKKDDLIPEDGGLFDPTLVGIHGDHYNHVSLHHRIPNPMSEEPLRKLLKMTKASYDDAVASGEIEKKLKAINLDGKIDELKKFIASQRKSGRDDAVKALSFLTMLKSKGLTLDDMMLSKVPVIPAQYRPVMAQGDQVLTADINELYKDLMLVNKSLGDAKDIPEVDPAHIQTARKQIYNGVKAVYGLGEPIQQKSIEKSYKGLLASALGLQGGSAKESMFQAKVVNKPIDLVGRAVLLPDSNLDLNQSSIPQTVAWNIFSPFVIRRLVRQGVPATKAREYLDHKHPLALAALHEEMADRPGIVTRDPQLSKYNFQGMYLKMNPDPKDFSIKLNPLVFKGYGGDSDGDQLNVQLPASDEAKEEVKEKLLPEKNLIYHRTFSPIYTPSNEAATGLFAASFEDKKNKPAKYNSADEVVRDFLAGKLDIGDRVELP
jgi:DNA-directed RNA polymerase subunit beta'